MKIQNVVSLLAMSLCACCARNNPTAPTVVVNVNNVLNNIPEARPTPTSTPPPGLDGVIVQVNTGFFGGICPGGGTVRNSQPLAVGCTGFATATPIGEGGLKLPPEVHGPLCTWTTDRPDVVRLQLVGDNQFNVDVVALRPGVARVFATVKGVVGFFDVEVR